MGCCIIITCKYHCKAVVIGQSLLTLPYYSMVHSFVSEFYVIFCNNVGETSLLCVTIDESNSCQL